MPVVTNSTFGIRTLFLNLLYLVFIIIWCCLCMVVFWSCNDNLSWYDENKHSGA
jgi:hypothetical protein